MAGTRGLFWAVDSMEHAVVCEIPETDGGGARKVCAGFELAEIEVPTPESWKEVG